MMKIIPRCERGAPLCRGGDALFLSSEDSSLHVLIVRAATNSAEASSNERSLPI
jgi:hypothetical protein